MQVHLLAHSQPVGRFGVGEPVGAVALRMRKLRLDHALQLVFVALEDLLLLGRQTVLADAAVQLTDLLFTLEHLLLVHTRWFNSKIYNIWGNKIGLEKKGRKGDLGVLSDGKTRG